MANVVLLSYISISVLGQAKTWGRSALHTQLISINGHLAY